MSKPLSSVGSKIRGWLKKHLYYDALFMLRSASHAGMQQLREMLAPLAAAFRAESAPRKIRPYVPSGEVLEDRQLLTTVQFSAGAYALIESGGAATISVTLDAPSAMTITVDYATADGTAVQAIDYTSVQGTQTYQTLVFAPNDTVKSFTVTLLDDSLDEYDETVSLVLANPTGATLGSPASSTLTILDDDSPPTVALDASSYSVSETAGAKTITVELSAESGKTVTVDFATSDGTATAGTDYGSASGVLTFAPGQTSKTFSVPITDDEQSEGDETVALTLSSPSNASLGAYDYADLTITNTTPTDYLPDSGSAGVDTGKGASVSFGTGNFNINLLTGNFHLDVPVSQSSRKGESDVIYYYAGLAYNSNTATPNPMVSVRVPTSAADPSPTQVRGRLTWGSTVQDWVTLTGSYVAGKELFFSLQSASTVATTGRYNYAIDVELSFATRGAIVRSFTGSTIVVVNGSAPFGYGWSLPDLNYLVTDGAGGDMILVQGDGGYREFSYDSGSNTYSTPEGNGDNGIFTKTSGGSVTTYTYTDSSQIEWIYKSNGQLVNVVDPSGQRVTYAYDGDRLSTVIQPTNFAVTFTYSGTNLSSITRGYFAGSTFMPYATTTVTYSSGDLTGITDSEGNSRTFGYTAHKLTSDSHGPQIGYSNGAAAQAAQGSGLATFTVSALLPRALNNALADTGIAATITNPGASAPTSITLDSYGRSTGQISPLGARSTIVRDSTGMPSVNIDANANRTTSTYDGVTQRPATITDAMGGVTTYLYSTTFRTPTTIIDPAGRVTTYVLDSAGNVLNVVDSSSNRVSYTWSAGLVQSITDTNNRTTTFLYDSYRQLQVAIDPSGQRTTYSFNPATGSTSIDTVNAGPTSAIDDALGRRTVDIDANGNRTSYTYTAAGQREATIEPNGNRTTTVYDTANRPIASIDSLGNRSTTVYDAAGRVSSTIDIYSRATTFLYDEDGRRTGTINSLGNRTTTVYDPAGHVLRTIDQYGKTTTFLYDDAGRQTGQIDPFGNRTTTIYDAAGNVVTAVDQFGHVTTNTYANGNLTSTIDWLNLRTTYTYTAAGKLETVKDQYGFVTTNLYDASNRLAGTINAFGNRTTITYTATSQIATQSDEFGNVTTFHYDASDRLEATEDRYGRRATTVYDAAGRVEATVDVFGNRSTTVYDGDGRTVATIDYLGNRTTTVYDIKGRVEATIDPLGNRVTTVYDAAGRVEATIDMLGQRTTSVYDGFSRLIATVDPYGNRTSTAYDAFGQVEATIDPFGNRSTFVYDSNGRQIATIDPYGNRATTVYDSYGRVAETIDIYGKYTTTVYDAFGRVEATVDKFGNRSTTVYDTRGRIEATVDMLGNRVTTVFDSDGRQVATIDIYGNRSTTVYDAFNRISAQIDGLGRRTTFLYDSRGRQEATIDPLGQRVTTVFDARGRVSAQIDALGNATTFQYDASGRQEATIDAFGHRASVYYDSFGRTESTTDLLGNRTTTVWDSRGRQVATIDSNGHAMTVAYDSLNRQHATIDQYGFATTAVYDAYGRQEATIDSLGNRTSTVFDAHGNVSAQIDQFGNRATYHYDSRGRQEASEDQFGKRTTTVYDTRGRVEASIDVFGNRATTVFDSLGREQASIDYLGNRTTSVYDAFGRIEATINALNKRTTSVFDSRGRTEAMIDQLGNRTSTVFDAFGRVSAQIDQLGNRTTSLYDVLGRQEATIDSLGNRVTTVYDALGRVQATIDQLGNRATTVYDALGRAYVQIDQLGNRTTSVFDGLGRVEATIDQLGNRTTTLYDTRGRVEATIDALGNRVTTVYDSYDRVSARIDATGNRTTFLYDSRGRQEATIDALGNRVTTVYDSAGRVSAQINQLGERTTNIYDATGRQEATLDAFGNRATTVYDAFGRVQANVDVFGNRTTTVFDSYGRQLATIDQFSHYTTIVYDSLGRQQATIDVFGHAATAVYDGFGRQEATIDTLGNRATTVYDSLGRVSAQVDQLGNRTTYVYDSLGRQEATINALGNRVTTVYDTLGRVSAQIDSLGSRLTTTYDSLGRQEATRDALNNLTTTVYDAYGRVSAQIDKLGNRTSTVYDAFGRYSATIDPSGNRASVVYDAFGRQQATIDALNNRVTSVYDELGRVKTTIDGLGHATTTTFDSLGRQQGTIDYLGNRTTTSYDGLGRVASTIDRFGNATTYVYDNMGRQTGTLDYLGNRTTLVFDAYGRQVATIDELGNRTTTVLDDQGRQVNLIDASGNKTTFAYDALNREIQKINPNGAQVTQSYDAVGRLASTSNSLGRRDYGYDAIGRKTTETWVVGGSTVNRITFTYDAQSRVLTAGDFDGTYTLTYNAAGQVATVNDLWGNLLTFTYDARGNRTKVQDSQGGVTTSVFDADNQLTSRQFGGVSQTPLRIDYTYNANGQVTHITRYGNLAGTLTVATTATTYNVEDQITNLLHKDGSNATISSLTFTYDAQFRLQSQNTDGTIATYVYDSTDQVTSDGRTTVQYDATGNRTTVTVSGATSNYSTTTGNRLQADGTWDYVYDTEGNMTSKYHRADDYLWIYEYDQANHLTHAYRYDSGATLVLEAAYKYDAFGNRIEKSVDNDGVGAGAAVATRYAYDQWNPASPTPIGTENAHVWAESTSGGSLTTRYLYGDATDDLLARIDGATPRWYLKDQLGSIRKVIDGTGVVKDSLTYDAFGNITAETDANERGRYAWTSREVDVETALQYNRARYYDATTGRWISQDPLGFDAGDSNLYRYVMNRPTMATDPSGLDLITSFGPNSNSNVPGFAPPNMVQSHKVTSKEGTIDLDFGNGENAIVFDAQEARDAARKIAEAAINIRGKITTLTIEMELLRLNIANRFQVNQRATDVLRTRGVITGIKYHGNSKLPDIVVEQVPVTRLEDAIERDPEFVAATRKMRTLYESFAQAVYGRSFSEIQAEAIGKQFDQWRSSAIMEQKERLENELNEARAPRTPPLGLTVPERRAMEDMQALEKRAEVLRDTIRRISASMEQFNTSLDGTNNESAESRKALNAAVAELEQNPYRYTMFEKAAQIGVSLIPVLGSIIQIGEGVRDRNPVAILEGFLFLGMDVIPFVNGVSAVLRAGRATARIVKGLAHSARARQLILSSFRRGVAENFANSLGSGSLVGGLAHGPGARVIRAGEMTAIQIGERVIIATAQQAERMLPSLNVLQDSCFVAGTKLLTPEGEKSIENFKVGDEILARDEGNPNGPVQTKIVEETFVRVSAIILVIVNGRDIRTTAEHPFFVRGKGWICARELSIGDELSSHDGQWVTVEAVTDLNEVATVYNLRVSDYHTYFVGSREWGFSVWAHNANYVLIPLPDGGYRLALVEANGMVRIVEGITHATLPGVAIAENVGILTRAQIERILAVPAATSGTAGGRAGGTLLREVAGTAGTAEEKAAALVAGRDLINARFGEGAYTLNQIQNPNGGWILFEGRPQTISSVTSPAPVVAIHPDGRMFKSTSESLTRGSRTTFDPYVAYRRPELRDPSIAARNYYCQEFIGGNWVDVPPLAR